MRQQSTTMMSQAVTLNLHGLPNDLLINFDPVFCIVLAAIYAHVIYPGLSRMGITIRPTTRICIGLPSAALALVISAINQHFIYRASLCGEHALQCVANPPDKKLPVWIQIPVYVLIANSAVLALISGIEYAYSNAPRNMRSVVLAMFYLTVAFGGALAEALVPVSHDPWLVVNYGVATGLCVVATAGVQWCVREQKES